MSLILEALKKLEREKKTPERGFLVTTSAAWPARGSGGALYVLVGLGLAAAGALGTWLALGGARHRQAAVAPAPLAPPLVTRPEPSASVAPPLPTPLPAAPAALPSVTPAVRRAPERPKPIAAEGPVEAPSPPAPVKDELRLEAVSQRDGLPVAVLSGRLVHEGDAFDNVRVIRIGPADVEIEVDGQRRVLSF